MMLLTRGFWAGESEVDRRVVELAGCELRLYGGPWWAAREICLGVIRDVAREREELLSLRGTGRVSTSVEGKRTKSESSCWWLNVCVVAGVGSRGDWG